MTFPALRLITICLAFLTVFLGVDGTRAENAPTPDERVMLVLDASGSMWGKIGEEHKITIARKVIVDLLQGWEPNRHLGLIAYGHRQRGECSDIEVVSPVGPADIDALTSAINNLNPKGKTPITAAVQKAAEALRYTEERATVILVSDGLETCNADPCAAAKALEAAGIDLTVHVVGFDLGDKDSASLQCVADETGGQFVLAGNAEQLEQALKEVARAPEPSVQYFEARVEPDSPPINDDLIWTITQTQSGRVILRGDSTAQLQVNLPAGPYLVEVIRTNDETFASKNFTARDGTDANHTLLLPLPLPTATLLAPDEVRAGSQMEIDWTGPNRQYDNISIALAGSSEREYKTHNSTKSGSPITVRVPETAGDYEIRYMTGIPSKTLASRKLLIIDMQISLSAPDRVDAGSSFKIEWTGANNNLDFITIVPAGTKEGSFESHYRTQPDSPLQARAPDEAGDYEIRYLTGIGKRTVAARKLIVNEVEATIDAVDRTGAGSPIEIAWTGPNNQLDTITIVPANAKEGEYTSGTFTSSGSPIKRNAPDKAGTYEIRYLTGQSRKTLAVHTLIVTDVQATLAAFDSIEAGSPLQVGWTGPINARDFITIVPVGTKEGTYKTYAYTKDGSPLEIRAPDTAGDYEIRYLAGQSRKTLAARKLVVTEADATLSAADSIEAGSPVKVDWTGPNNERDFITIVLTGTKEGKYKSYVYTKDGTPLEIRAPDTAGDYEIRYLTGQSKKTLAAHKLVVTEAGATLNAVDSIGAGSALNVDWTGPNNERDFITIVAVGTKEGKYKTYVYTKDGSPLEIRAPDTAGNYEIRYLTGQSKRTVVARNLIVTDVASKLTAADSIDAGSLVSVDWTGPNNDRDFITIVPVGTKEGRYKTYVYTKDGSPLEIRAPDEPGDYEIRYLTGQSKKTLATRKLVLTNVDATLIAVDNIGAGSPLQVEWTGPNYDRDFLTIVPTGTKEGKYQTYVYTKDGSPLEIRAPDEPGDYEIRYLTGQSKRTLATQALNVTEVAATLWTAQEALPEQVLKILWTGPDNDRDFITIVPADAKPGKYQKYVYTKNGSPMEIPAPSEPGSYEIRYLTGQSKRTLVALPLEVKAPS